MSKRRVVVTGLGIVSPLGSRIETVWQNILQGESGIGPITRFDTEAFATRIGGAVRDFNIADYISPKEARRMDEFIHYGVAAGIQAVDDAGIDFASLDSGRCGVISGAGIGGLATIETEYDAFLAAHGPISSFVTAHGWDAFRDREAEVVAASVAPGRVVALGGGSVDRAATAGLVADRALVVWVRERRETLAARLAAAPRPALTGLDPADEIATVLEHRDPIHARLSDLELPPNESVERRVERVRHWLAGLVAPTRTTPHG